MSSFILRTFSIASLLALASSAAACSSDDTSEDGLPDGGIGASKGDASTPTGSVGSGSDGGAPAGGSCNVPDNAACILTAAQAGAAAGTTFGDPTPGDVQTVAQTGSLQSGICSYQGPTVGDMVGATVDVQYECHLTASETSAQSNAYQATVTQGMATTVDGVGDAAWWTGMQSTDPQMTVAGGILFVVKGTGAMTVTVTENGTDAKAKADAIAIFDAEAAQIY